MERIRKREQTLFFLFLKQVTGIAAAVLVEIILFVGLFYMGLDIGIILPANYIENYLSQIEGEIAGGETGLQELIPETCEYGIFDLAGNYLEGNLSEPDSLEEIRADMSYQNHYKSIERDEEYVIIRYGVTAQFSNPVLHRYFPQLEVMVIALFWGGFLMIIAVNALWFGRKLRRKLVPLLTEIEQIKKKELEPTASASDIKEFNEVLQALDEMKEALGDSLKKEWETEQRRIENISALAHDIKTPLTIIKGNVELLQEETEGVQMQEYAEIIHKNADRIEQYIRLLLDEAKGIGGAREIHRPPGSDGIQERLSMCDGRQENGVLHEISLSQLIETIKTQSVELCRTSQIPLVVEENDLCKLEWAGKSGQPCELEQACKLEQPWKIPSAERIERAILNIVSNAIDHSTMEEGIRMYFAEENGRVCITVEDFGEGFSREAMLHATEQFYTEHKERSGGHYGMGLYFADMVAEELQGELRIENKADGSGARVSFCF